MYIPSVYAFKDQGTATVPPNTIIKYNVKLHDIDRLAADNENIDSYIADREEFAGYEVDFVYGTRFMRHVRREPAIKSPMVPAHPYFTLDSCWTKRSLMTTMIHMLPGIWMWETQM